MEDCIFCKIVAGVLPCYKVYEDDEFIAFLDIHPKTKGDTLVIPKKHVVWSYDLSEDAFGNYWKAVLKITKAIQKALDTTFVHYFTFGVNVPHSHIHIIPHYEPIDNPDLLMEEISIPKDQMEEIAGKIKEAL